MNTKLVSFCAAALCGLGLFSTTAQADILLNVTPGGGSGNVQVTSAIPIKVTVSGSAAYLLMDALVENPDGNQSILNLAPGQSFQYTINGGPTQSIPITAVFELGFPSGAFTADDGGVFFNPFPVVAGDTLTVLPQTWQVNSTPADFNPQAVGTFAGRVALVNSVGTARLSNLASVNRSVQYAEKAVELYNFYAGMGQQNLGLHHFFDNISLSLYYFHLDSGDKANAEFNFYKFKGLSLKYLYQSQGKPKLGRYFQFLNLGLAHKRYWILKGNPRKGQLLYIKYRTIALAARR